MKVIIVNTPKGQYSIPLETVAEDRAEYYVEMEDFEMGSLEWDEEIKFVMEDDFEGIDWIMNNGDWEEWEEIATKINNKVLVTEDDFWSSTDDFKIIEDEG